MGDLLLYLMVLFGIFGEPSQQFFQLEFRKGRMGMGLYILGVRRRCHLLFHFLPFCSGVEEVGVYLLFLLLRGDDHGLSSGWGVNSNRK